MPTPADILQSMQAISSAWWPVALAWHIVLAAVLVATIAGCRPPARIAARLTVLPLASVSIAAWAFGNPFNGLVPLLLGILLVGCCRRLSMEPVGRGPGWSWIAGVVMLAFGWVYPHFVEHGTPWSYLYASPFGLLPCPTLSLLVGLALMAHGFGGPAYSLTVAIAGLFYGLFGAFRLGVQIDLILLLGSVALFIVGCTVSRPVVAQETVPQVKAG